jgi:hypothetical protein
VDAFATLMYQVYGHTFAPAAATLCLTPEKPGHGTGCICDLAEDPHPIGVPCPVPLDGGMCGCDEDEAPVTCGRECDC